MFTAGAKEAQCGADQGRSFDRSADAAGGGYEQWSQQTRGDPSAELAARYGVPAGFGAAAASAMTPPATMPPGVAFAPAPFGMLEPPWVAQARVDASVAAEHAAALHAQQMAMGMTAQPGMTAPTPWAPAGMYAPAPTGTTEVPLTYQQRFGAGAMNYQQHGAGGLGAAAAAAGAERPSAAPMGASQGPQGRAHVMGNTMPEERMRRVFELGQAAMMREEQEARGAAASELATATATAAAQLITPQQLAMNASGATVHNRRERTRK